MKRERNKRGAWKQNRELENMVIEAVMDGSVPYDSIEYAIRRRLSQSSTLQNGRKENRRARLERQRRNLLSLLCRVLEAAPEYKLRQEELAIENVGSLLCLSPQEEACLRFRMI